MLEADEETKEPVIEVHKKLICKLKPHQVEGSFVSNFKAVKSYLSLGSVLLKFVHSISLLDVQN